MFNFIDLRMHTLSNSPVDYPDAPNQMPRKSLLDEKLGLLTLLYRPVHTLTAPFPSIDRVPVDLTQSIKGSPVFKVR